MTGWEGYRHGDSEKLQPHSLDGYGKHVIIIIQLGPGTCGAAPKNIELSNLKPQNH